MGNNVRPPRRSGRVSQDSVQRAQAYLDQDAKQQAACTWALYAGPQAASAQPHIAMLGNELCLRFDSDKPLVPFLSTLTGAGASDQLQVQVERAPMLSHNHGAAVMHPTLTEVHQLEVSPDSLVTREFSKLPLLSCSAPPFGQQLLTRNTAAATGNLCQQPGPIRYSRDGLRESQAFITLEPSSSTSPLTSPPLIQAPNQSPALIIPLLPAVNARRQDIGTC